MIISNREPLEFYHLTPINMIPNNMIVSLEYYYINNKRLYKKYSNKYRNRIVNEWKIITNKLPEELTLEEIHKAINIFREDNIDGNNRIYLFKYLPYKDLGNNMERVLEGKRAFKIDIEDNKVRTYIKNINWGYWMSDNRNRKLNRHYYNNVSEDEYFKYYKDSNNPLFKSLNHIAIILKNNSIPLNILEEVEIV